jgi:hypothetical protein
VYALPLIDDFELPSDARASAPNDTMFDLAELMEGNEVSALSDEQNMMLKNATSQTRAYVLRKAAMVKKFFDVIEKDPKLRRLCEFVPKPGFPNENIRRFYVELNGSKSELKYRILNRCLVIFAFLGLLCQDGKVMEPNTTQTSFKILFSVFRVSAVLSKMILCTRYTLS